MKLITTLGVHLLAGLLLVQAFQAPIVYVSFKLQQDYIAKNLCARRSEPITVCYGKCVLRKELSKTIERREKDANQPVKVKIENVVYCLIEVARQSAIVKLLRNKAYPEYISHSTSDFIATFFVPPRQ